MMTQNPQRDRKSVTLGRVAGSNEARKFEGRRYEWLDALRGWAVLGVVLVHSGQLIPSLVGWPKGIAEAGQYGVQLFFVISALTIFLTYSQELKKTDNAAAAAGAWWTKRYFRIAPLYYYGGLLYFFVFFAMRAGGSNSIGTYTFTDAIANLLFINSWLPSAQQSVVPGGWSIGVEMMFYLSVPLIFALIRTPKACFILLLVAVGFAEVVDRMLAPHLAGTPFVVNDSFLYFWFPTQVPVFLAGAILFSAGRRWLWTTEHLPAVIDALAVIGFIVLLSACLYAGTVGERDHVLAPTLAGGAFCCLVLMARGRLAPLLVNTPLVRLGRVSYSVYINHFLFIFAMRVVGKVTHIWDTLPANFGLGMLFAAVLALTYGLSLITYRFIEAPGIEFGKRLSERIRTRGVLVPMPSTNSALGSEVAE